MLFCNKEENKFAQAPRNDDKQFTFRVFRLDSGLIMAKSPALMSSVWTVLYVYTKL